MKKSETFLNIDLFSFGKNKTLIVTFLNNNGPVKSPSPTFHVVTP